MNNNILNLFSKIGFYFLIIVVVLYSVFPIYWMVVCGLQPSVKLFTDPSLLPVSFSLASYDFLFSMTHFLKYYWNSIVVAVGTSVLTVSTVVPLSYALTRFRIPGATTIIKLMLAAYMFPVMLLAIPMFVIFSKMGLADTLISLIIAHTTLTIPLGVWLMWGFFKGVPVEIEEAALVDGATPFKAFLSIVLPLSRPGIITTGLFTFIVSWTDYVYALALIYTDGKRTVPLGLDTIAGAELMRWGELMAGSSVVAIPSILAFAFVTRYLIQGLAAGAVKG